VPWHFLGALLTQRPKEESVQRCEPIQFSADIGHAAGDGHPTHMRWRLTCFENAHDSKWLENQGCRGHLDRGDPMPWRGSGYRNVLETAPPGMQRRQDARNGKQGNAHLEIFR